LLDRNVRLSFDCYRQPTSCTFHARHPSDAQTSRINRTGSERDLRLLFVISAKDPWSATLEPTIENHDISTNSTTCLQARLSLAAYVTAAGNGAR
jgi:hypothetical protein